MIKKTVKLKKELPSTVKQGDILNYFDGKLLIKDLDYTNQYGTFVLCEYTSPKDDKPSDWITEQGMVPATSNPYEVVNVLTIPYFKGLDLPIGYVLLNSITGEEIALTYNEAWMKIHLEGAVNASASRSKLGNFTTNLIEAIEQLPALDSAYWKKPAYTKDGEPVALLSPKLKTAIRHKLSSTIRQRISQRKKELASNLPEAAPQDIQSLRTLIEGAKRICLLTGAGFSTMSGIPDYRSAVEGVWQKKPELMATLNQRTFLSNPIEFWKSYRELLVTTLQDLIPFPTNDAILSAMNQIQPNDAHRFLQT